VSGLGAVRLVSETSDRKIPLQDWTPWRGSLDGDQQWLNLKPTSFSEVKTTASVHSPDLARIEGGWFVSIKDASACLANAEGSTLYLDHFSDFGSYGGPIVDPSGAVISIIKNSRVDTDGGLCASNKSSTIKNSLGPLSRYYADGSHVTEGIQITSELISKLKELDPSIGTSSPAPITKDILRPGLAIETAQRFEIPILSPQFTESAYPVAELDAPAIEIAKQATVAFLRETGCATCDENRRTSNFNIGCICTGFAITQTLIVTNDHCVTDLSVGAKTTFLTFYGQEVEAELVGKSSLDGVAELTDAYKEIYGMNGSTGFHRGDVALLRTVQPMLDVQPLKFADSSKLEAWQPLITVGHPAAMTRTGPWVTGVGSFVGGNYFDQTDQAYNLPAAQGASGSPVVNLSGELVGQIAYGGTASGYEKTSILTNKYGLFALELEIDTVGITPAPYSEREDIPISPQTSSGAPSNYIKEMVEKWAPGELSE
jgi:S1-C subfamily serine protease